MNKTHSRLGEAPNAAIANERTKFMKELVSIHQSSELHWVGNGFPVRSVFSYSDGLDVSPFLLLDYAAPREFSPSHERRGVGAGSVLILTADSKR